MRLRLLVPSALALGLAACGSDDRDPVQPMPNTGGDAGVSTMDAGTDVDAGPVDTGEPPPPTGLPVLGNGAHTLDAVEFTVIADRTVQHDRPTDLAFHPTRNELWVINQGDNTTWIASEPGTPQQTASWRGGAQVLGGSHFMAKPSGLAFGDNGNFTTSQDENEVTQPSTPADFMGPTLWSSDMQIYDGGHFGHLDMLHNSPSGKGVAWGGEGNKYWYFDGFHNSITMYDFNEDHGPGGSDHSDGEIARYAEGEVQPVDGVPSHMEYDASTRMLYIADTGNNRVAMLDTMSGSAGIPLRPNYDGVRQYEMDAEVITTFVDGAQHGLQKPTGLAIYGDHIFVADNENSKIFAFNREGELVDYLETGRRVGALAGITFDSTGDLWFVDMMTNEVLRVSAID